MIRRVLRRFRKAVAPEPSAPLPAVARTTEELERARAEHEATRIRLEAVRLDAVKMLQAYRDVLAQRRKGGT